ncbi:ABC transporter substrate-binding protein [Allonocardiopsis opalescens]|uniref:Peptide/nickel transport system substrate-binding protein n=1 Tax=Allonocardiopsis opalescens TaxID=1144618 RepID=A0A2T0Q999_9ACTN|nr:ABC transporter substrate-binding protein [Allonocardiopsis opalescens]PRY00469.1 peptide/nickel transport system substrate-binding protein [Allonocardiopsis opalescens]
MLRRLAASALAAVTLTACGAPAAAPSGPSGPPVPGGTITIGINSEVSTLDPAANEIAAQATLVVAHALYEPLFTDGPGGALEPRLAESLTSEDLRTWTLSLRPGLTFSDGSPLDAQAVVDHVARLRDPESQCQCAQLAAEITDMAAADATTAEFTLAEPNAGFPRYFTRQLGMIASTTARADDGSPLGAGPYRLESAARGSSLTVVRSEHYQGTPGHADTLVFQFLPDTDSRYQSLASGAVDLAWIDTPNLIAQARGEGRIVAVANASTATAVLNTRTEPFDDIRVRQAVQAAIDREALLAVVDQGQGVVAEGPILSRSPYASGTRHPEFDPERARTLLAEVGEPVSFAYTTDSRPQSMQRATAIQQMLGDVGITMTIDVVDTATWGTRLYDGDFAAIEFVTSAYADTDAVLGIFAPDATGNFGGYANPEVGELVEQGRGSVDEAARREIYAEVAQRVVEDAPVLFFTESPAGFAAAPHIGGMPDLSDRNVISLLPSELWTAR